MLTVSLTSLAVEIELLATVAADGGKFCVLFSFDAEFGVFLGMLLLFVGVPMSAHDGPGVLERLDMLDELMVVKFDSIDMLWLLFELIKLDEATSGVCVSTC